jgi:hypothetical protein
VKRSRTMRALRTVCIGVALMLSSLVAPAAENLAADGTASTDQASPEPKGTQPSVARALMTLGDLYRDGQVEPNDGLRALEYS